MCSVGLHMLLDRDGGNPVVQVGVLAIAYHLIGRFGLAFASYHDAATLLWPPTGLALAVLVLYGVRLWPGVFLGAISLNWTVTGAEGLAAAAIAMGNTLEAVVGSQLLVRVAEFRPNFERVRDVFAFLLVGVLACTIVSASIGVATLAISGTIGAAEPWRVWLIWWLGDAGGALILAPAILLAFEGAPPWRTLFRNGEFWTAMALIFAISTWSVSGAVSGGMGFVAVFTTFPLVVWAGTRLGSRGAVLASFTIMFIATVATARGIAPFVVEDIHTSMTLLWTYGITMGATGLTLAATTGQRDRAEDLYRREEAQRYLAEREQLLLKERERMVREMHDGLGGQLVSTISMLEHGENDDAEVIEALRRALDDMRIVIDSLDPNTTNLGASLGKLRARLEPLLRRNGIQLQWQVADDWRLSTFPPEQTLNLLRIIQEAVTNAMRHAAADTIEVRVAIEGARRKELWIEVRDDGGGIREASTFGGRGIHNMEARAASLGAELSIEPLEPGTRVLLRIPLAA